MKLPFRSTPSNIYTRASAHGKLTFIMRLTSTEIESPRELAYIHVYTDTRDTADAFFLRSICALERRLLVLEDDCAEFHSQKGAAARTGFVFLECYLRLT